MRVLPHSHTRRARICVRVRANAASRPPTHLTYARFCILLVRRALSVTRRYGYGRYRAGMEIGIFGAHFGVDE